MRSTIKIFIPFILFTFFGLTVISQNNNNSKINEIQNTLDSINNFKEELLEELESLKLEQIRFELKEQGLPKVEDGEELIMHSAMALVYDEEHKLAKWVAHILTYDIVEGKVSRSNDFRADPKLQGKTAVEADYFLKHEQEDGSFKYDGYGYDRGHLAPSADFRWSEKALSESFYYSNMTPQKPDFNRIAWANLENTIRAYIQNNTGSRLFIVTAPVINDDLEKMERGVNKISIPEYHYKIIVSLEGNKGVAFLMPNELCEMPLENYSVSIDSIENLTGIDFFHNLPNDLQASIESQNDPQSWLISIDEKDKKPIPMSVLPRNHFNTTQAKRLTNTKRPVSICGTVVSATKSGSGNVFLNLDKSFPNHIFSVTIFKDNIINFSYEPHIMLKDKKICVTGKITEYNGVPSMVIDDEKSIEFFEIE
ncbi:MAG: DNA/RNA non-specific endonuclease [Bacteroidales bacterium]